MQSRGHGHDACGNGGLLVGIQYYMYNIAFWCNGSTRDFDSRSGGLSPPSGAIHAPLDELVKSPPFQGGEYGFEPRREYQP